MIPGHPIIVKCPFCDSGKRLLNLLSGNSIGAKLWSDNKRIARMLPMVSAVQRCPTCGKYYFIDKEKIKYAKSSYSYDTGELSFQEAKEALLQFENEGFESDDNELKIRIIILQSYNDFYFRNIGSQQKPVEEQDRELFVNNCKHLVNKFITDNVFKAELYREIGDMENARKCLDSVTTDNDFLLNLAGSIREKIDANDTAVFQVK